MFNDNFNYEPSESETKAVNKSYVFQKGSLFVPTYGSYDERTVLAPYMVLKPFSIEQVVTEFLGQLEMHSYGLEDEVNKIIALMIDAGYIVRVTESAAYDFGGYRFLGDPIKEIKSNPDVSPRTDSQVEAVSVQHEMKPITTLGTVSISDEAKEAILAGIDKGEDVVMTHDEVNEAIRKHTSVFGGEPTRIEGYAVIKNKNEVRIIGMLYIQYLNGNPVFQIQLLKGEIMPEEQLQYCSVRIFHKYGYYDRWALPGPRDPIVTSGG